MRRSPRRYLPYRLRGAPGPSPQRRMPDHFPRASSYDYCIIPGAYCQIFSSRLLELDAFTSDPLPDRAGVDASRRRVVPVRIFPLVDESPGYLAVEHVLILHDLYDYRIVHVTAIVLDDLIYDVLLRYGRHVTSLWLSTQARESRPRRIGSRLPASAT